MFRLKHAARAALLLVVAACAGDVTAPTAPGDAGPAQTISDAAHAGAVPGFYFLPPMVPNPSYSGTFDGGLQPTVEICELAGTVCATTVVQYSGAAVQVNPTAQNYQVNWHTNQFNLDPAKTYRISVYVGTFRLGYADVDVVNSGKELKNVNTQQYIPLQDGRTLPIKFRIETGIAGQVIVTPDSASVPVGGTQQFTATVLDLHGNPIPGAPVTWASSNPAVATVDGTGLATGVSVGQVTITATSQAASGSATLTVFNPNTPPVAVADTFEAIGNVTVPVAAPGVLANDTDGEGNPLSAVPGTFPTAAGGTVTMNADGSFSYLSAAGFTGQDSFEYTVTDGVDSATGTVTVVSAYRVWYVDNAAAAPGDGRDASPFVLLKDAEAASAPGETIFLRSGNGTSAGYDAGIVLKTGQSLAGQGVPSNVTATLNGQTVVLLAAGAAPTVTRTDAGATVQISTNNVIQGFDVASTAGAGIAGTGFGTLTVGSMSVSASGGPALDLSSGDVFGAFDALSSTGSTGAGIRLLGIGGSFSAAGGSITGAATAGVDVTGGDGVFSYGGDVVATGPLAVFVANRTGGALTFGGTIASTGNGIGVQNNAGGTIAFNGASKTLSTGTNPGVRLVNNTGATISFGGGGLAIATTTGTGFEATGGGTVTVTGAGNAIAASSGTALRVENTTVGGSGLTFRSISAANAANGIVLNNTGALNGLQVTGTGAAGSGGTITGMSGDGVRLDGVTNVSLSWMAIQSNQGNGIGGAGVTGFALNGSTVLNNTDDAASDEAGIRFDNLWGTSSIAGSEIAGSIEDNVRIANTSGNLTLSVTGTTFRDNSTTTGRDGLGLLAGGNAQMTVSVSGSHLLRNKFVGVSATTEAAGVLDVTVSGGSLVGNTVGVNLVHGSTGALTFDVLNIPVITGHSSSPINVNRLATAGAASTFAGTVSGNVIGTAGVPGSGSAAGSGVRVVSNGAAGAVTVAITGNTIREVNSRGVDVLARDGGSTINASILNNNIVLSGGLALEAIRVDAGALSTDAVKVCAAISGNTATAPSVSGIRVRQRFLGTTFQLAGYAGAPTDNAAVAAFLASTNTASGTQADNGGPGFTGVASCPTP